MSIDPDLNEGPFVLCHMRFGSEIMSFGFVDAKYSTSDYSPSSTSGDNGYLGPLVDVDSNITFPFYRMPVFKDPGLFQVIELANNNQIPDGHYKFLARAINPFRSFDDSHNWSLVLTLDFIFAINKSYLAKANFELEFCLVNGSNR